MRPLKDLIPSTVNRTSRASTPTSTIPRTDAERLEAYRRYKLTGQLPGDEIASNPQCTLCGAAESMCRGMGYVQYAVDIDDANFGKMYRCPNLPANDQERIDAIRRFANLEGYRDKRFDSFNPERTGLSSQEQVDLGSAITRAMRFAQSPSGWLVLSGLTGTGKTHLAAAIANVLLERGDSVIFMTVPDLLDHLRATYRSDADEPFDTMIDRVRAAPVLILDDLGTENPTEWAAEKLFQIINYRYVERLPTVFTTNKDLRDFPARLSSRLRDETISAQIAMSVRDFRTNDLPTWMNPLVKLDRYAEMRFETFDTTNNTTAEERANLAKALNSAASYAQAPEGWLFITGGHGTGKTHLSAAIALFRQKISRNETDVCMVSVSALLDQLRTTFAPESGVKFNEMLQYFCEVETLVLEDIGGEYASAWARDKLFQILDYRYIGKKYTVLSSTLPAEKLDQRLFVRLADERRCTWVTITAPPYVLRMRDPKYNKSQPRAR